LKNNFYKFFFVQGDSGGPVLASDNNDQTFLQVAVISNTNCQLDGKNFFTRDFFIPFRTCILNKIYKIIQNKINLEFLSKNENDSGQKS
jgi:hypothetical protein